MANWKSSYSIQRVGSQPKVNELESGTILASLRDRKEANMPIEADFYLHFGVGFAKRPAG